MTTGQIIIVAILFGFSFIFSAAGIFQENKNNREACIIASIFCTFIITLILVGVTFRVNKLSSDNPCPELEKLENVYKIK